jgi:PAS domain S-box/PAS domain S-box
MTTESTNSTEVPPEQGTQNQEIFRLLVSGVKDYAIFMLDPKGFIMTWNEGAKRLKGYSEDEIIGEHFSRFYTEDAKVTGHPQRELELAIKDGRYEEEGWRLRKDGTKFWANIVLTTVYDEKGTLIGFAKVTRDLTDREDASQRRSQSEQQEQVFRLLVSGVQDYAIFMIDPNGNVMTWNEGAQRLKGYVANEIIGKHFSNFYPEELRATQHPQRELEIAKKEGRYEEEGWRVRKDGSTFWANVVITAIYDQNQLVGFAKVTRDLTERRESEKTREAAARILQGTNVELERALEVKSRFLSTISHEVRTPMSGIIGMTELLTLQDLGDSNNHLVKNIFESSKRLLQLLNDMLDTTRMESGKLKLENRRFPIKAVVGDVVQLVRPEAQKKNLEISSICNANVPESVCGDEFRVRQILLNLAFNAVKFTDSGLIKISCQIVDQSEKIARLRFDVYDTGIGIAPHEREQLFEPFHQARESTTRLYGGSGLGLSIAKSLVELMGGEIGVESEADKGSTFWFQIPFNEANCSE